MALIKKIYVNGKDEKEFFKNVEKRAGETDKKVTATVSEIIENVKENGDKAVKEYTEKFDGKLPQYYEVPREVINDALTEADQDLVNVIPGNLFGFDGLLLRPCLYEALLLVTNLVVHPI